MSYRPLTHLPASVRRSSRPVDPDAEVRASGSSLSIALLSRRSVLVAGLSAGALIIGRSSAVLAEVTTAEDLLTRFLQWSRVATGLPELDVAIARECLELHLRSGTAPADLHALDPARYRGTEFERRLLEVWYTGVFRPDVSPNGRNDATTLMWRAAGSGPPGQCKGSPDSWATAPDLAGAAVG